MRLLITGATGYVGQNFLPELIKKYPDMEIMTVNISVEEANSLFPFSQCSHISIQEMDKIVDFRPELVYHLAALSTSRNDYDIIHPMVEANIEFGVKLLHFISMAGSVKLFVNIGSFAEYGMGPGKLSDAYLYTATKSAFRHFVDYYSQLSGFQYITLVPYTLYGGKDTAKKLIDYMRESLIADIPVKMTKGEQILDFTNVADIVSFFILISDDISRFLSFQCGEEFHIGTGIGTRVRDLAVMVEKVFGKKCNIEWGGLPYRSLDTMYAVAPIAKNIKLLNWRTSVNLMDGLEMYKKTHTF